MPQTNSGTVGNRTLLFEHCEPAKLGLLGCLFKQGFVSDISAHNVYMMGLIAPRPQLVSRCVTWRTPGAFLVTDFGGDESSKSKSTLLALSYFTYL